MVVPEVLVIDDLDEHTPYVETGVGHYPVKGAFYHHDSGALVVVLDYQKLALLMQLHVRWFSPPTSGPSSRPDPGEP